jgi:ketosteroid isomerase-like protein
MGLEPSQLADIEEIRQLSYTYYFGLDTGDLDLMMSVFADDAVFDMRGSGQPLLEGAPAIRDFFATEQLPNMKRQIHLATNHRIQLDGDRADSTVYFLVHGEANNGSTIFAGGYHADSYARTPAGWRYTAKVAYSLLSPQLTAIGGQPLPDGR